MSHMIMPAMALAIPLSAVIAQLLKQSLKEVVLQDYVLLAQAKGFSETRVILFEALKNAVLPTLTLAGVQFTFLIGGTVIVEQGDVETLFSEKGHDLIAATLRYDRPEQALRPIGRAALDELQGEIELADKIWREAGNA